VDKLDRSFVERSKSEDFDSKQELLNVLFPG
jgi:hypothetical protein